MTQTPWRKWFLLVMLISITLNIWSVYHIEKQYRKSNIALRRAVLGMTADLNHLVSLISENEPTWNEPAFRVLMYGHVVSAIAYARMGDALIPTTGCASRVAIQLSELNWILSVERKNGPPVGGYHLPAMRLAAATSTWSIDDQQALEHLAEALHASGWPLPQAKDDQTLEAVHSALDKFIANERMRTRHSEACMP